MNAHNFVHIKHTHTNFYTGYEYTYTHTHRGIHKTLYTDYENTKKIHTKIDTQTMKTQKLTHIHLQIPTQTKNIHTHIVYTQNLTHIHVYKFLHRL